MKTIRTKLNEKEYPEFRKEAEKGKLTDYGLLKLMARHAKEFREFLKANRAASLCVVYWSLWLYSLAVGRILLV